MHRRSKSGWWALVAVASFACQSPEPCASPGNALTLGGEPSQTPCERSPELCGLSVSSPMGPPSESRLDLVFVSEGFTEGELSDFGAAVETLSAAVETDILIDRDPELFAFHRIDLVSETNEVTNALVSDTALGGCLAEDTLGLSEDWFLVVRGDLEALGSNVPGFDALIVLFNSEQGRANASIDLATDPDSRSADDRTIRMGLHHDARVLSHELGHVLFGLGDEYADSDAVYVHESRYVTSTLDPLIVTPNLSLEASGQKWAGLVEGAKLGGRRFGAGIFHPTDDCRMLDSTSKRFCPVCEHRIEQVLGIFADSVLNDGPPRCGIELDQLADRVMGTFDLQLTGFDLNGMRMSRFTVDGEDLLPVLTATAACPPYCWPFQTNPHHGFALGQFDAETLGPGPHELWLRCEDALGLTAESSLTIEVED